MALFDNEKDARRLARAIASDLACYNEGKIAEGIEGDCLFTLLAEEIDEGRAHYRERVAPSLYGLNLFDRALVDILVKSQGNLPSKLW
ncbi:MAG: hypothetical protein FJ096_03515 [Deltaproteobacteria bacterium]|nr:hypothetical protein [Deltaproteobacteria bacterium]